MCFIEDRYYWSTIVVSNRLPRLPYWNILDVVAAAFAIRNENVVVVDDDDDYDDLIFISFTINILYFSAV